MNSLMLIRKILSITLCATFVFYSSGASSKAKNKSLPPPASSGISISCRRMLELMEDPMTLLSLVAVPYSNHLVRGFEVKYIDSAIFPNELDLRTGDIVTHIQDRALNSLESAQSIFWSFQAKKPKSISAKLIRNSKSSTVIYLCRW
jgi:hypothetical protein